MSTGKEADANYDGMVRTANNAGHLWTCHGDKDGVQVMAPSQTRPTREELVESMQVTENFVCVKGVKTSTGFWSREECEKKLDAYGAGFKFLPSPSRTIDRQHAAD